LEDMNLKLENKPAFISGSDTSHDTCTFGDVSGILPP